MSPHQRVSTAALAGDPGGTHQPGDAFAAVPQSGIGQLGVHPWRPVRALRPLVHRDDLLGKHPVDALALGLLATGVLAGDRETRISWHARLTLCAPARSASMNGYPFTGSPGRGRPWPA